MANKVSRKQIYQEQIQNELSQALRSFNDSRLTCISITKVELTDDLAQANVYWDTWDSSKREDATKAFESAKGRLRSVLAQNLKVRHVPQINPLYDSQYEAEEHINKILKSEYIQGKNAGSESDD